MAIKVSGTTVIDSSRTLQNVTGLKTVNDTSILGSGNIDAETPTTYGDVGTYVEALCIMGRTEEGNTKSGSSLRITGKYASNTTITTGAQVVGYWRMGNNSLSGTYRMMFDASQDNSDTKARYGLWVRIS